MPRSEINRSGEMEVFARVVELGGFSPAARALASTRASHHMPKAKVMIEAMMPRVRVMAKPLTGPVACQKRMAEVMSVVTMASKMAEKALS